MKTKPSDGAGGVVAAIDWVAPAIKPSSEWSAPGTYASDVLRRGVDFHYRMPLWLAMPVGEAEKLRVTRIVMALTTTTTEASVASGGADAAAALDDGTYVRVCRDGGADGGGATEALTVTTRTSGVSRVDVYGAMPMGRAAPFWTIALAIVALSMMTACGGRIEVAGDEPVKAPKNLRIVTNDMTFFGGDPSELYERQSDGSASKIEGEYGKDWTLGSPATNAVHSFPVQTSTMPAWYREKLISARGRYTNGWNRVIPIWELMPEPCTCDKAQEERR